MRDSLSPSRGIASLIRVKCSSEVDGGANGAAVAAVVAGAGASVFFF